MEQEKSLLQKVQPVNVVKTTPQKAHEVDYVITIPNDVDIDEYTEALAKDLRQFLAKEMKK